LLVFVFLFFFFFNDTATTEIYTLSLHDALPICRTRPAAAMPQASRGGSTRTANPPWERSRNTSRPATIRNGGPISGGDR